VRIHELTRLAAERAKGGGTRPDGDDAQDRIARDDANIIAIATAAGRAPAFSDEAIALSFAEDHADKLRFVATWGKWLS
jgi:hypothetical protein